MHTLRHKPQKTRVHNTENLRGIFMDLDSSGFLNLGADIGSDIALVSMILLGVLLTFSVVIVIRGKYEIHRYTQTVAVVLSTILVFYLMVLRFLQPEEADDEATSELFNVLLFTHILIGSIAVLLGIFITLRANGVLPKFLQFQNYKPPMRVSYILYMLAIFLGVWVYVVMPDRATAM